MVASIGISYWSSINVNIDKNLSEEEHYAEYEEKYKNSEDYNPDWMQEDVNDLIIHDYIDAFKAEIAKEIGCEKVWQKGENIDKVGMFIF